MEAKYMNLEEMLKEEKFDFVSEENKIFILEFTKQIKSLNYDFDGNIGSGFERGNYQIIYSLNGIKGSRSISCRIFLRDDGVFVSFGKEIKFSKSIVLRLYFSNINKHIKYIENAPINIKELFINNSGLCKYCIEHCYKRKTYTLNGLEMVKCADVFEIINPKTKEIKDYVGILNEFYGKKGSKEKQNKK
jgi:hypothetical protein